MPVTIQKVSITHDAIIDLLIVRPELNQREIAAHFGYTPTGIGIICRSDAFKARLEARKAELVDPLIKQSVEDRLVGLAHQSIDILSRKLDTSEDPKLALAALDAAQKSAGYGARSSQTLQAQFVVHLPGPAASSADWAARYQTAPRIVSVDASAVEAPSESS
jgi:hypothetical protein